jgi:GNAT superfamily N-acetyltransferase
MCEVRSMSKDDLDECSSLSKAVRVDSWNSLEKAFYPKDKFEEELLVYSPESLSKFIGPPERFAFVAVDEGKVRGCVIGKVDESMGIADIGWIFVAREMRGRGIAGKLMEAASAKASEAGCHKIIAFTMKDLPDANAMYRRYGFEQEGDFRRHWMKIDFVQFGKQL